MNMILKNLAMSCAVVAMALFSVNVSAQAQTDIAITVTDSVDPVIVNSSVNHTVTVTNTGVDAIDVIVGLVGGVSTPTGVTIGLGTASQGVFDGANWAIGALNDGASATLVIPITVSGSANPGDVISTTWSLANSSPSDSNPANDQNITQTTTIAAAAAAPPPTPVPTLPIYALLLTILGLGYMGQRWLRAKERV